MVTEILLYVGIVLATTVLLKLLWKIREFPDFLKMEVKAPSLRDRECLTSVPVLSVIIPANDEEANIAKAARSVLASECSELELILIDDRSRDNTVEAMHRLEREDSRVKVVSIREVPPDGPESHMRSFKEQKSRLEKSWFSRMQTRFWTRTRSTSLGICS